MNKKKNIKIKFIPSVTFSIQFTISICIKMFVHRMSSITIDDNLCVLIVCELHINFSLVFFASSLRHKPSSRSEFQYTMPFITEKKLNSCKKSHRKLYINNKQYNISMFHLCEFLSNIFSVFKQLLF